MYTIMQMEVHIFLPKHDGDPILEPCFTHLVPLAFAAPFSLQSLTIHLNAKH